MKRSAKVIRLENFEEVEKALYICFTQNRAGGLEMWGPLMCEKANELAKRIYGDQTTFNVAVGWKNRFYQRHGIHMLTEHGEKLSADQPAATNFVA